jgi:phytoene dehydrogenase-like protein
MKYDVIVVGAGLGGLIAGAKLAKEGKSVLLVEQHDRPGGCATTFNRKGFTMEVGLHEMDGLHASDMKWRIFRDLGVDTKVQFLRVPEFYQFVNERYDVVISHDPSDVCQKLIALFPEEVPGIEAYFYQLMNIRKIMKQPITGPEKSAGEFLDSIISNEDLKLILLGNLGYFHDDPYTMSLTYYSMAQSSYYAGGGGNYIKGGSQVLSDYLAGYINDHGGKVLLNHLVTSILTEDSKVTGIRYRKTAGLQDTAVAQCDLLIANASVPQVARLLPDEKGKILEENIGGLQPGASLLTVYLGFNQSLKEMGNPCYSTFVFDRSVKSLSDVSINNRCDYDTRSFAFVDYSHVDSELAPPGKGVGAVCCIDYAKDWEALDRESYKRKKEEVAKTFISRLGKLIPGFQQAVEYYEVGTALTVKRYTLNPGGAVYGFAHTPDQSGTTVESPLANLHFASAWTKTGGGYSGAIMSGYLCAMGVLREGRG